MVSRLSKRKGGGNSSKDEVQDPINMQNVSQSMANSQYQMDQPEPGSLDDMIQFHPNKVKQMIIEYKAELNNLRNRLGQSST